MKENFLHFISKTPATINVNGEYLGNLDYQNCELDVITKTPHIFVTYQPISNTTPTIPYTYLLHTMSEPDTQNQYVKVVPFPNNNYDIIMKPFYYYQISEPMVLFNGMVGKYFVSIVKDNITRITVFSGGNIVFTTNAPEITSVKVEENKGLMIIEGLVDADSYYLLVLDTSDFSILHDDTIQSIESGMSKISTFKDIHTLCHHARICSIDFSSKKVEKYYVYKEENPSQYISPPLIPLALLQCVKIGDENICKSLLSKNLENSTCKDLSNYFGDFEDAYLNRHSIEHKLNYTIDSDKMKNYNFLIESSKIVDIEENF